MKKQLLLLISMLLPMVAMADDSGSCGTNVTYTYESSTNTLTIQGSGTMTDYSYDDDVPWYSYRKDIKTVVIKDGVTSIGQGAFMYCSGLTSIEIPNSVTSIGSYAFSYCTGLTSIEIPNSVTSIGSGAFDGCSGLTSIEIPNSVTSIGSTAFFRCSGLTSITIPNSVTSIGGYAFSYCTGLTSIEIPNSVTSIGYRAFYYCSGLTSVSVEKGNSMYDSRNNCNAIIETSTNTLIAGCMNSIIPNSVTSIGDYAFEDCSGLTSIEIPNSVTSIGSQAFYGCDGLTSIEIPNSVTSIGRGAFFGCSGLTSIVIPNSVTSIGIGAFEDCSGLTSVTIKKETPLPIEESTFSNRANATLYVPYGSTAAYEAANYWKEFKEIIEMPGLRCATPTISFKGGKLHFECETSDVTYHYTITPPSKTDNTGNDVEVGSSYTVQVYASKDGYLDSDPATQDIDIRGIKGDVDGDGVVDVNDVQTTINIILKK